MSKTLVRGAFAALAALAMIGMADVSTAEAKKGGGGGHGGGHHGHGHRGFHGYGHGPRCFRHYDRYMEWCGVRNGRYGCFVGGYRVMCL